MDALITFLVVLGVIGLLVYVCIQAGKEMDLQKEKLKKQEDSYIAKYGQLTKKIEDYTPDHTPQYSYIFEESKTIIINDIGYKFSDILDFTVNGGQSYRVTTSTSGALGRGIVGGVLFGGIGALAGAGTASKKVKSSDKQNILIAITTRNLSNPMIEYRSGNEIKAQELISVLKIIIDRENKDNAI